MTVIVGRCKVEGMKALLLLLLPTLCVSTRVKRHSTCLPPETDLLWKEKEDLRIEYENAAKKLELYIDETERKCLRGWTKDTNF